MMKSKSVPRLIWLSAIACLVDYMLKITLSKRNMVILIEFEFIVIASTSIKYKSFIKTGLSFSWSNSCKRFHFKLKKKKKNKQK